MFLFLSFQSIFKKIMCDTIVGVSDLVTLASLKVTEFESCVSQKYCVTMQIALMCPELSHAINSG